MSAQDSIGWADDPIRGAGARRRHNRLRQDLAKIRQAKVATLLLDNGWRHGSGVRLARELGVSQATISRDVRAIFSLPLGLTACPLCGTVSYPDSDDDE